ncbi:MAG: heparan-alpha-glucosaminide N-acetyltransferase domain-containing protein [Pseudomonadota bacterium]
MNADARPIRVPAIDWMRGIVLIVMVTDHASAALNPNRLVTDTVFIYNPEIPLPPVDFYYRWISHICAPVFLFLAGTALALSITKRRANGASEWSIDRDLLVRGGVLILMDLTFISWFWGGGSILFQVLYAIGASMIAMTLLRRLPVLVALVLGIAMIAVTEPLLRPPTGSIWSALNSLFFAGGPAAGSILVAYPVGAWLGMMLIGWWFGQHLLSLNGQFESLPLRLLAAGFVLLGLFALVRGVNAWGNLGLLRYDDSLIQWLHFSKYPPSISFITMELGLMCLLLAGAFAIQNRSPAYRRTNPLLVFGQTSLFFYVVHILMLELGARATGMHLNSTLAVTATVAVLILPVLYPLCIWFRKTKQRYPTSPLKYI